MHQGIPDKSTPYLMKAEEIRKMGYSKHSHPIGSAIQRICKLLWHEINGVQNSESECVSTQQENHQ